MLLQPLSTMNVTVQLPQNDRPGQPIIGGSKKTTDCRVLCSPSRQAQRSMKKVDIIIIQASAQSEYQLMQVMVQPRPKQVHRGGFIGERKIFTQRPANQCC